MRGKWKGRRTASALSLVFALLLAACGGGDDSAEESGASETTAEEATITDQGAELDDVFQDDLEDDENGWDEGETEDFSTSFTDDGYEVTLIGGEDGFWSYADEGPLAVEDSSTTVEVDEVDGAADRDFGPICRLQRTGPLAYYTLTVNSDTGAYTIARWTQGDDNPDVLEEGEDDVIEGVGEDETAEITGTCLGEGDGEPVELALAVNGTEVATATDDDGLAAGINGLSVLALDGDDRDDPVVFSGIEVRGDEVDADVELEDDFSDSESGFDEFNEDGNLSAYEDDGFVMQLTGSLDVVVPIRGPLPDEGTATVDIQGDLTNAYVGICLSGPGGKYEFAASGDGYGSLGVYPEDGSEFDLIDEASEAYEEDGTVRLTAGWNTNGSTTNLVVYADDEVVTSAGDATVTSFSALYLCGTVNGEAPEGTTVPVIFDDLVVSAEA